MNLTTITRCDVPECERPRFPRKAFRGEFRNHKGEFISNLYFLNGRVYLAIPRDFGRGEIAHMIPGSYDPKDFERAGGLQVSANSYIKFWQFKV